METVVAESTQQMLRPGKCVDLYYPDPETAEKACFRTTVNTKFQSAFTNLTGGTNVFTLPPNQGFQDFVLVFRATQVNDAQLALPRGWGYALINKISYRIGGSSQYFETGQQILIEALESCPDAASRNDLLALGGSALTGSAVANTGTLNSADNYAYVYIKLPWSRPTSMGKPVPLPSDLLTTQVQITVDLNNVASIYSIGDGTGVPPSSLASAIFQVQQVALDNRGDELARRVDMTVNSLSYPVIFAQQETPYQLANSASVQNVSITGFRAGEVKSLIVWLTKGSDVGANIKNPLRTYAPRNVQMTYAGDVYARFDADSGELWNLINSRKTPKVANLVYTYGGGAYTATPADTKWLVLPFSQAYDDETAHSTYLAGKEITNGIIQLALQTPTADTDWILHVAPIYNSVVVFSQGTCDFSF